MNQPHSQVHNSLYIGRGIEPEEAGRRAADELFEIVPDLMLKSQADTIEALLDRAKAQ